VAADTVETTEQPAAAVGKRYVSTPVLPGRKPIPETVAGTEHSDSESVTFAAPQPERNATVRWPVAKTAPA
jgi:hypothetical protein